MDESWPGKSSWSVFECIVWRLSTLTIESWWRRVTTFFGLKLRPRKWIDLPSVSNLKWYTPFFNFGFFEDCWYINKWIRCSLWEINGFAQKSLSFHGFQQSLINTSKAYFKLFKLLKPVTKPFLHIQKQWFSKLHNATSVRTSQLCHIPLF